MGGKVLPLPSEMIKQEGRLEGRREGLQEGRLEGLQEGRREGLQEGRLEGLQEGRQEGCQEGRQDQSRKTVFLVYRNERSVAKAAFYGDVSEEQAYAWLEETSMI